MNTKRILAMADDPKLDPLLEPFEAVTSAALGAHDVELQRLFDELKVRLAQEDFDRLYRLDVLRDEGLSRCLRVGFVCGLLMGGDPLRVLMLRE